MSREVDRVVYIIENTGAQILEGCKGWLKWLATGGGSMGLVSYVLGGPGPPAAEPWREVADVPRAEDLYRPQGLAYVDGDLWLTDHHRNRRSHLYRLDADDGTVRLDIAMPDHARHPGGLAYDGTSLWAVDYVSARLYRIDPEATAEDGQIHVDESWPTDLKAASALEWFELDGRAYLAISDFRWRAYTIPPVPDGSAKTYILPVERVRDLRRQSLADASILAYHNGGYSQGLVWLDDALLESVNHHKRDAIRVLDVAEAIETGDPGRVQTRDVRAAPGPMVEDLATDGERLWTSDEATYKLYVDPDPL